MEILKIVINPDILSPRFWMKALVYQFVYSILGLMLGLACIILGVVLFLHGIAGTTKSWTASMLSLHGSIADAPAGTVLFIVGLFVIYITRFVVESREDKRTEAQAKKKRKGLPD